MSKQILIFVPHPDDDVLSFGGLMAKAQDEGDHVHVHCFAVGGPRSNVSQDDRAIEFMKVMDYFGCTYGMDTGKDGLLSTINNTDITSDMDRMINELHPDEVYCTCNSEHADHQSLYRAFLGACRLKSGFMPKLMALGEYPFLLSSYTNQIGGKIYQPLTDEWYRRKVEGFSMYKSQFKPSPSPLGEEGVRILAETRGLECGHKYAELYYQIRYTRGL